MPKRICNWCAKVADEQGHPGSWSRVNLRIEGLHDGSISWLPEKVLDFCAEPECRSQVDRTERFLLDAPSTSLGEARMRLWLRIYDEGDVCRLDSTRYWGHEDAAQDARALAHFFTCTSHPRLRRVIEEFEP